MFTVHSCRLDQIVQIKFGFRLDIWYNSEDKTKFWTDLRPNACRHLKNLCKLGLRVEFGLTTKSDVFFKSTTVSCPDSIFTVLVLYLEMLTTINLNSNSVINKN